jgi:hypothetical protein
VRVTPSMQGTRTRHVRQPEIGRGPAFEFHLNHVLMPDSPTSLFRTEYEEL